MAAIARVQRVEVPDGEHRRARELDQPHGRRRDRDQRALRARHELRQVEPARGGEAVEPVAAGLAPVPRVVLGDRAGVALGDAGQLAPDRALERVRPRAPLPLGLVDRTERGPRAVGQHDLQLQHVVDRGAVEDRRAPGGVVADHAAERGAVGGRGVRAEAEPVRLARRR